MNAQICFRVVHAPHLEGPAILPAAPVFTPEQVARAAAVAPVDAWNGPALWAELHTRALGCQKRDDSAWLAQFRARLPCGACRGDWPRILHELPPRFGRDYFGWSVAAHNAVNRTLGKPEMTVGAARKRWKPTRRARKRA